VDARERVLGRLARSIAVTLMGKHKPIYDPAVDAGDYVVVTNASHIAVSGRKAEQKLYRHHTMYPGGLKEIPFKAMLQSKPEEILRRAVSGMLPKNKLRERRLERLKIFPGESHPYEAKYVVYLTPVLPSATTARVTSFHTPRNRRPRQPVREANAGDRTARHSRMHTAPRRRAACRPRTAR